MKLNRYAALATLVLLVGALAIAVVGGIGIASASGANDDAEPPITGDALDKASAAALAHTGGGRITEAEVGDGGSYYEVEVALDDGSQVEVHLDENFKVIGQESDRDGANDQDGPSDK
jgi:hypothetical protein